MVNYNKYWNNWSVPNTSFLSQSRAKPTESYVRNAKTQIRTRVQEINLSLSTHRVHSKDWSDYIDGQTDLSLHLVHTSICTFSCALAQFSLAAVICFVGLQCLVHDRLWQTERKYIWQQQVSTLNYRKNPKITDTRKICSVHPKIWTRWLYHRVMSKRCRWNDKQCRCWSACSSRSSLISVCPICPKI